MKIISLCQKKKQKQKTQTHLLKPIVPQISNICAIMVSRLKGGRWRKGREQVQDGGKKQ